MSKKIVKLTESDLHKIVKESVNRIINEIGDSPKGQFMLGRTYRRAEKRGDKDTAISASNKAWDRSEGGGRNYRNFKNGIDFQDDMDTDKAYKNLGKLLNHSVKESVDNILNESEYDNFFDWADNSSASPEEIEAASQRHDSRIPSIKSPTDKLARRERVFNRRASMNDPDIGERIANRKDFIKNQKQGERFRNRITK